MPAESYTPNGIQPSSLRSPVSCIILSERNDSQIDPVIRGTSRGTEDTEDAYATDAVLEVLGVMRRAIARIQVA